MLEVIGAGATATSRQDWPLAWIQSPEAHRVNQEIERIHIAGRQKPTVQAAFISEFATSWLYQTWELTKRNHIAYWRDPMYLIAKLALNIFGGLFIGFTFFKASNSQQGTQNKLFVRSCMTIGAHQLIFNFLVNLHGYHLKVLVNVRHADMMTDSAPKCTAIQPTSGPLYQ